MVFGWDLIDSSTYNWASIKKGTYTGETYTDRKGTEWRKYGDFNEATKDLGNIIQNNYFDEGRYSIEDIGSKYCESPDPWIKVVSDFVSEMYANIGQVVASGDSSDNSNEDKVKNQVTIQPNSDKTRYKMVYNDSSENIDNIKKQLEKETSRSASKFSELELAIFGALMDNGANLDYYTEEQLHCLPAFIKAEACTQYLDLRPNSKKMKNGNYVPEKIENLKESEVPGVILVQRTNTNSSTPVILEYKKESDFNALVSSNNRDAINYFTVDNSGNLVIAKWDHIVVTVSGEYPEQLDASEKETSRDEYVITTEKIPYSEYIKKYIMPFEFLLQLLVVTEEPDFCMELVDQVLNSKIVINIQEEETITDTTENRKYTVHVKNNKRIDYTIGKEQENDYFLRYAKDDEGNDCTNYSKTKPVVKIHKVETSHSYVFEIIEADTWIAHYTKSYDKMEPSSKDTEENIENKGKYKKDDLKIITNKTDIEKDADVKKFKQDKETNYKNRLPIPSVAVTQFSRPLPSTEAIPEQQVFRKISITPENTFTTNLTTDEFVGIPTTDIMGNTTYQYNMPQSITVTTIETDNWPFKVNFQFSLNNDSYTNTGDDTNDVIKCDFTRLKIQPHSKIDLKNKINTKTTIYPSDPNPITKNHIYATESGKPGKGDRDEDTVYEKFLIAYSNNRNARDQINSIDSWLYEMMEKRDSTAELVDILKYLLYMYDGNNRGISELQDFDTEFNPDEMNLATSVSSLDQFTRYLHSWEGRRSNNKK